MTRTAPAAPREALFTDQGVIVRLQPSDSGQTWVLSVRTQAGPNIDALRRAYPNPTLGRQAYLGMCALFAAGYTVAAVIDFANQVAAPVADYPLTPCEVAA